MTMFLLALMLPFVAAAQAIVPTDDLNTLIMNVLTFVKQFGGLPWVAKVASIIAILISISKVSALRGFTWDKLPEKTRIWLAPFLGLIYGLFAQGTDITAASALAYMLAGAGAPYVHEMLDGIKLIPGIGPFWVNAIEVIKTYLGAPKAAMKTVTGTEKDL